MDKFQIKISSPGFSDSASSTATIVVFTSDFYYLPAKEFVSLVINSDRLMAKC